MDFNAAHINSTNVTRSVSGNLSAHKILQEGSVVNVRVTGSVGGGKYEGFVAGVKVHFTAERALKAGDTFSATVSGNGSKIILTPQTEGAVLQNLQFQMNEMTSGHLASLLQSAGLPPDSLSSSIFQMFKQTGLKIDAQFMSRIRNLALRFGGKEKAAAEILIMLAEKGISADEEEIKNLLLQLSGEVSWQEETSGKDENKDKNQKIINRINSKEGAWYLLPFELIQFENTPGSTESVKSVLGKGNIRLLFDSGKLLKLMNLDCSYKVKRYVFSLPFEGGKCKGVRFNTGDTEEAENQNIEKLKKLFMAADLTGLEISNESLSDIEGNASGLENIYTFGGEA